MHLIDVRQVKECIQVHFAQAGTGFFIGFPASGLFEGLAVFHEPTRQGPVAAAWLDGAPAKQDLVARDWQAAGDDVGVLVVNECAVVADKPQAGIAVGDAFNYRITALATEFHALLPGGSVYLRAYGHWPASGIVAGGWVARRFGA
ncbi:hypothetical protein D3C80_1540110 [compost metagenome]